MASRIVLNNPVIIPRIIPMTLGPMTLGLLLCLAVSPVHAAQAQPPLSEPARAEDLFASRFVDTRDAAFYLVQPYDRLFIFVYGEPELSGTVLVRPDGRISVPLAQDVQAGGLTPGQLKLKLEERIGEFIDPAPDVTVRIEEINNDYQVYVTGEVRQPGAVPSRTPITVLQALAQAGSFEEWAKKEKIVIIRGSGPDAVTFDFNYERVIRGERLDQNIELQSGDVVVVPR